MKTKRIAELALLTAIALIIFIIELRIPNLFAIPGVKLGLANIVTVYAVYKYSAKEVAEIWRSEFFALTMLTGLIGSCFSSLFRL